MKIGFATYAELPGGYGDDLLAAEPLRAHGIELVPFVWDDPAAPLADLAAIVVRSCWDYHVKTEAFAAWLDGLEASGARVFNPAPIMRWNMSKRYLSDLGGAGVPVPRTIFLARGEEADLGELLAGRDIDEAVVKPVVSLSAYQTWRTSLAQAAAHQADFAALLAERDVMIQPLLRDILTEGELSFMFFGGRLSHAMIKRPAPGDFRVQKDHGGRHELFEPTAGQIAQAQAILDLSPGPLLFARIDVVSVRGELVLMELEAIDPVLFLGYEAGAPQRFANAIAAALRG